MHFTNDPNCLMANNTITGGVTGTCTGGSDGGDLDISNTGTYTVSFQRLYMNSQPWSGISWQLFSGTSEQCGPATIPVGPCSLWPIIIPPGKSVHVTFGWIPPSPTFQVRITMWTSQNNYLDARTDPNVGLVCSTRSIDSPKEPIGFC